MNRNYLLSTTAFSPPDDGGAAVIDEQIVDTGDTGELEIGTGEAPAGGEAQPAQAPKTDHATPRVESRTDSIRRAVEETKEKTEAAAKAAAAKKQRPSSQAAGAATGDAAAKSSSETTTEGNAGAAPQAVSGPPAAWSKEEKAVWDSLPEVARQAISRREADTAKGVQELRTRYQDIDAAVAPYKAVMTQNNVTPAQAINQLFKWHMELAGPNKVQAFQQLARNFGIDPATLAAAPATTEKPAAGADPGDGIPDNLRPVISNLETRLKTFEERESAAITNAAKQTWLNWSKDKPHAETVRTLMANLINSDLSLIQAGQPQVSNTIKDNAIDMDAAYQAAIYAHPGVRATLLQEEQAKRDKEAKAAAERARKAGASLRSGAPAGAISPANPSAPRTESIADSIKRALAEVRGTQH